MPELRAWKRGGSSLWAFWPLSILKCPIFLRRMRKCTCAPPPCFPLSLTLFQFHKAIVRSSLGSASGIVCMSLWLSALQLFLLVPYPSCQDSEPHLLPGPMLLLVGQLKGAPVSPTGECFQLLILGKTRIHKIPLRPTLSLLLSLCPFYRWTEGKLGP